MTDTVLTSSSHRHQFSNGSGVMQCGGGKASGTHSGCPSSAPLHGKAHPARVPTRCACVPATASNGCGRPSTPTTPCTWSVSCARQYQHQGGALAAAIMIQCQLGMWGPRSSPSIVRRICVEGAGIAHQGSATSKTCSHSPVLGQTNVGVWHQVSRYRQPCVVPMCDGHV